MQLEVLDAARHTSNLRALSQAAGEVSAAWTCAAHADKIAQQARRDLSPATSLIARHARSAEGHARSASAYFRAMRKVEPQTYLHECGRTDFAHLARGISDYREAAGNALVAAATALRNAPPLPEPIAP